MSDTIISPNMNLPIPTTSVDTGPDYANNVNASLLTIDAHNHSSGQGLPVNPNGININADLLFNSNNATTLRSIRFYPQLIPLALGTDLGCLYESGVDLYYNDGNGNQVRITQSGGVAGSPGSIGSLTSPASATYVSANQTFVWQSDASTPANLDAGSIILRNISASSKGITLGPPLALSADYALTLPSALPGSTSLLQLSAAGAISASNTLPTLTGPLTVNGGVYPNTSSFGLVIGRTANTVDIQSASASSTRPIVVSANPSTSGLMIVRGTVNPSAAITTGEGFTTGSWTSGTGSSGIITITFSTAFVDVPSVTATVQNVAGNNSWMQVTAVSTSAVTFATCITNSTGPGPQTFSFIAIGQRNS